jgi:DNA-directed RNA polymerase subunit RPC12/RpoP
MATIATTVKTKTEKPAPAAFRKFFCIRCKYKFRIKKDTSHAIRCPNCGQNNLIEDNFDINKVIEEASDPMYDR